LKFNRFVLLPLLAFGACATTQKSFDSLTAEDRAAIEALANQHLECLGEKTALYIGGSDDVALLTRHISSLCEPILVHLNQEIQARGLSAAFARGYVQASREEGEKVTTSFILREKAKAAK
jgi:hypothetical protein